MKKIGIAASAVAAVLAASSAWAYVPPSAFLVRKVAEKRKGFLGVAVRSAVIGMRGETPSGVRIRTLTTIDYPARKLRSRAQDEEGRDLYGLERDLGANSGVPVGALALFGSGTDALAKALRAVGVPVRSDQELLALPDEEGRRAHEIGSIARFKQGAESSVAFVIGETGEKDSQFWVEQERFLPLRLVSRSNSLHELRFEGYRFTQEFPFPRVILGFDGGSDPEDQVFREETLEVIVGAPPKDAKTAFPTGFTEEGNRADSRVRALILKYYQAAR